MVLKFRIASSVFVMFAVSMLLNINLYSQELRYKRAMISLKDGGILKTENGTIDNLSRTIVASGRTISFLQINRIRYSNTHAGLIGIGVGAIFAVLIADILVKKDNSNGSGTPFLDTSELNNFIYKILGIPLGMLVGYRIGSSYYYNWQEYPLDNNSNFRFNRNIAFQSNTVCLIWKIQLQK